MASKKPDKPMMVRTPVKTTRGVPHVDEDKAKEFIEGAKKPVSPESRESVNTDSQASSITAFQKPVITESWKPSTPPKTKVTWMLPDDLIEDFEDFRSKVKRMVPKRIKSKVTNSLLAEQAIELAIQDIKKNGNQSQFYRNLVSRFNG